MSKRIVSLRFGLVLILAAATAAYFLPVVSSQSTPAIEKTDSEIPASVNAKGVGFPRISYEDGRDLSADTSGRSGNSQKVMASGDFDSDGTPDLVTADSGGTIRLWRGNVDAIYQNGPEAAARRAAGTFIDSAFYRDSAMGSVPVAPDLFAAGDFNADGYQDVVAAAKGGSAIYLMAGDGRGNLSAARQIKVNGEITAMATGEIGRNDGQTDIAISVKRKGSFELLIFEHPEGAFARKPESIQVQSAANSIAIGNLDTDHFADIAVAAGNRLTIVRGRGQAYPWDMIADSGITRPKAVSETRPMPFGIAALVIGDFSNDRIDSIAMLTTSGSIEVLSAPAVPKRQLSGSTTQALAPGEFHFPSGVSDRRFASVESNLAFEPSTARSADAFPADPLEREEFMSERREKDESDFAKLTLDQQNAQMTEALRLDDERRERAKAGFLSAISPGAAEPLSRWSSSVLATDSRFASAASNVSTVQIHKVRISDSGRDELAFTDPSSNKIHLLIRETMYGTDLAANEVVSFDTASRPTAMLPMRLNSDAISDLVVLRDGSDTPAVVPSSPAATFVVTSTEDIFSLCNGSSACTLRGAILAATDSVGPDLIAFNLGGSTINLQTQLPKIFGATTVDATTQPDYAGTPVVELNGIDAPVKSDGLRVNGSNNVVRGFVVNRFSGEFDEGLQGFVGGNGISVFSFSDEEPGRNNIIEGNYSGTNLSGTGDLGNDYTALNIFNSDFNIIGGTTAAARNVFSGSGTDNAPGFPVRKIGVGIAIQGGMDNILRGNYVGTNAAGTAKINNSFGVRLAGGRNRFGGDEAGAGNVISGNGDRFTIFRPDGCVGPGISEESVINAETGEFITTGNIYKGNKIGTNASGTAAVSNCTTGLLTSPRNSSLVGSITESGRNTISGNLQNGLYCSPIGREQERGSGPGQVVLPEGFCSITGNNIGTDVTGNIAIPNVDYNTYGSFLIFFGSVAVYNTETLSNI